MLGFQYPFFRDLPGLIFCILAIAAQIYIGRRLRFSKTLNISLAAAAFVIYICGERNLLRSIVPHGYGVEFLEGYFILYAWVVIFAAVVLALTKRVPERVQVERRALLTASAAALWAAPAILLGVGVAGRKEFEIKELELKFANLAPDLQGLRLLQISDIHLGDYYSQRDLARVVDASNDLRADIVFITGDLITSKWDPLETCVGELSRLRSPHGLWGCMGNHELYEKVQSRTQQLAARHGIRFLRQEAAQLNFGSASLNLVGVDYQKRGRPYLQNVGEIVAPGKFNLLLSHSPDVFPVAAKQGFDLTLAGHTHGGQINFQMLGYNVNPADLATRFTKGFYSLPGSSLYVNSGLGTIGVPVRLGAPPEITLIKLCASL